MFRKSKNIYQKRLYTSICNFLSCKPLKFNNKIYRLLILNVISILSFISCNDKLDLFEEGDSVPIIYAILDPTETTHYVRINKSFYGDASPYDLAKNPDNILFKDSLNIKVFISDKNEKIHKELSFKRITMKKDSVNLEGNAIFSVDKHYVYISEDGVLPFDGDYVYKLEVRTLNGNLIAWAETNEPFQFRLLHPAKYSKVFFTLDNPIPCAWSTGPYTRKGFIHIYISVFYYEYNMKENRYYIREVKDSTVGEGKIPVMALGRGFDGKRIIDQIVNQINKNDSPDIEYRYIARLTTKFVVTNNDVGDYMMHSTDIPNFEQVQPITNIKGGFGLFGAILKGTNDTAYFDYKTHEYFFSKKLQDIYNNYNLKFAHPNRYVWVLPDSLTWR